MSAREGRCVGRKAAPLSCCFSPLRRPSARSGRGRLALRSIPQVPYDIAGQIGRSLDLVTALSTLLPHIRRRGPALPPRHRCAHLQARQIGAFALVLAAWPDLRAQLLAPPSYCGGHGVEPPTGRQTSRYPVAFVRLSDRCLVGWKLVTPANGDRRRRTVAA